MAKEWFLLYHEKILSEIRQALEKDVPFWDSWLYSLLAMWSGEVGFRIGDMEIISLRSL